MNAITRVNAFDAQSQDTLGSFLHFCYICCICLVNFGVIKQKHVHREKFRADRAHVFYFLYVYIAVAKYESLPFDLV